MRRAPLLAARLALVSSLVLGACGTAEDTDDGIPPLAELAPLSDGECPDLTGGDTVSFSSSGLERTATVLLPALPADPTPGLVFLHGFLTPDYIPEPTDYMARALDLQDLADELGAVIVLPESRVQKIGFEFYMWEVSGADEHDLVLYDDLRTCMVDRWGVDSAALSVAGFSGGSLFGTVLAGARGDTLATVVEMSGGCDLALGASEDLMAAYHTPAWPLPFLLMSGGEADCWPEGMCLADFHQATGALQSKLLDDGHYVVRCEHDLGHAVPSAAMDALELWATSHTYGAPSPFVVDGTEALGDWCQVATGS